MVRHIISMPRVAGWLPEWLDRIGEQVVVVTAILLACFVIHCICWWCGVRLRSWECIRRVFRATGVDRFDDFEVVIIVHEAIFPGKGSEKVRLRVRAAATTRHSAQTEYSNNGAFHEPLELFVEQGAPSVDISLLDSRERVISTARLDPVKDILEIPFDALQEREIRLSVKDEKNCPQLLRHAKLKVSMVVNTQTAKGIEDEGKQEGSMSVEMRRHLTSLRQAISAKGDLSNIEILAQACCGPLEVVESQGLKAWRWGKKRTVWFGTVGPPDARHWIMGYWPDEKAWRARETGEVEFDVLDAQGMQADPYTPSVFKLRYAQQEGATIDLHLHRVDRSRDLWVECLVAFVEQVRANHEVRKKAKKAKKELKEQRREERSRETTLPKEQQAEEPKEREAPVLWSLLQGFVVEPNEDRLGPALLSKAEHHSAAKAVACLNAGSIEAPAGYCVVFSASHQAYCLLYKRGPPDAPFHYMDEGLKVLGTEPLKQAPDAKESTLWSTERCLVVPPDEDRFGSALLDKALHSAVANSVAELNDGGTQVSAGYCVVYAAIERKHYFLYMAGPQCAPLHYMHTGVIALNLQEFVTTPAEVRSSRTRSR